VSQLMLKFGVCHVDIQREHELTHVRVIFRKFT